MREAIFVQFRKPVKPLRFSEVYFIFAIVCCRSVSGGSSLFTDRWAVQISGGRHVADTLAKEHGFINAGTVSTCTCT